MATFTADYFSQPVMADTCHVFSLNSGATAHF